MADDIEEQQTIENQDIDNQDINDQNINTDIDDQNMSDQDISDQALDEQEAESQDTLKVADIVDLAGVAKYKIVLSKHTQEDASTYKVEVLNTFNEDQPKTVYCQDGINNLNDAMLLYSINVKQFKFLFEEDVQQARSISTYATEIEYCQAECCATCEFSKYRVSYASPLKQKKMKLTCYNDELFNMVKDYSSYDNYPILPDGYQSFFNKNNICDNAVREAIARKCHQMKKCYYETISQLGMHPDVDPHHVCKLYSKKHIYEEVVAPLQHQ